MEFRPGAICNLRDLKPGDKIAPGPGRFPVTLVRRDPHLEGMWWADDADGRRLFWMECDLKIIGFDPEWEKRL